MQYRRQFKIGRLKFTYTRNTKDSFWGRFGGGWNLKVGIMVGTESVIFDCLIFSVRVQCEPRMSRAEKATRKALLKMTPGEADKFLQGLIDKNRERQAIAAQEARNGHD